MDEKAPITWVMSQLEELVSSGLNHTASVISSSITPLVSIGFGIYIFLISLNYLRGAETEPIIDFWMRIASFAIIVGLGMNAENYISTVIPMVTGIGSDIASMISGGNDTAGTLDQLALYYLNILDQSIDQVHALGFPSNIEAWVLYGMKASCILLGLIPFLVAAAITLIGVNVGSILVAGVGPIFFGFLLFPATRQYFSAWLNTALSHALMPILIAIVTTFSVELSKKMLINDGGTLYATSLKTVYLASIGNLILVSVLWKVSSIATSLSAGGVNVAVRGSIGTLARTIRQVGAGSYREITGDKRWGGRFQYGKVCA